MKNIRVVLVDDHPVILQGFKAMLESLDGIEVAGVSDNGPDGMAMILKEKPDVALMDIMLPGSSGLEVMRQLKKELPQLKVVLITASDSDLYLVEALRYGASGFLTKDSSRQLLQHAVQGAMESGVMLAAELVDKAFGAIARAAVNLGKPKEAGGLPSMVELTTREIDVLRKIAQGKTNAAIGKALSMSDEQVKTHVASLMSKLGTRDRVSAALQGMRLGLVE
jgi:DNA-binding NarL/FixJ family response regulator